MSYNFPWVPSYGSAATTKPTVQKIKFGDGYEQRVATGINSNPRQWQVTFASRTNDTADALEAFFLARGAVPVVRLDAAAWCAGKVGCTRLDDSTDRPFHQNRAGHL
jgi:phage-related protein